MFRVGDFEIVQLHPVTQRGKQQVFLGQDQREVGAILSSRCALAENENGYCEPIQLIDFEAGKCVHAHHRFRSFEL